MSHLHPKHLVVRAMRETDLPAVLSIERNAQKVPWTESALRESLLNQHICRVVEHSTLHESNIVGYHVVYPIVDELHILNIVVQKSMHGQGLGHFLINDIVDLAKSFEPLNIKKVFLEVRSSNTVAKNLYTKWQFKNLSIRKGYYRTDKHEREDALVMMKLLP